MPSIRWALSAITLFLAASAALADETRSPDPLFLDTAVLDVRLTAPISTLLAKRPVDEELAGSFEFVNEAGDAVELDIKVRTRGRFRRDEDNCDFPPIRLNFKSSQTKGTLFHKQNKVKLVTHCQSSATYEQALLSEYAAYRMLNVITDQSFRARLLRITYVDSDEKKSEATQYAFIIEHRDRLAKRMDKSVLEIPTTSSRALDPDYSSLVWMFHYLIGNTDFSPLRAAKGEMCCHNHVLFGNEGEKIWSVPYDFDQSGLVDAPYATPAPQFRIRSVKQRLYRGRCAHNDYVETAVARFQEQRESIMSVFDEVDMASKRNLKKMKAYVDKFYDIIDSDRRVQNEFFTSCK